MEMKTYEAMFLVDSTQATQEWDTLKNQIVGMIEKHAGVIINAKKWGERKLAYEIKKHKRVTYLLVYFQMPPENIAIVRRDFQLSEVVLRHLIIVHKKNFTPPEIQEITQQELDTGMNRHEAIAAVPQQMAHEQDTKPSVTVKDKDMPNDNGEGE